MGDKKIVQSARPGKAQIISRIEHAGGIAQQPLGVVQCEGLHEGLRRETCPAPEQVVQFVGVRLAASAMASMVGWLRQFSEMKAIARRTES